MRMCRPSACSLLSCDVPLACDFWLSTVCLSCAATDLLDKRLAWRIITWNENYSCLI
jgi:hypothetical protein